MSKQRDNLFNDLHEEIFNVFKEDEPSAKKCKDILNQELASIKK